ncbi:hypothetical protein GQ53DRAFT_466981 [Thozetella sp. PMI_491]|nr:hypothetical protein GQ53DRAFT_466981 [Thozetella sp. PMI_491]
MICFVAPSVRGGGKGRRVVKVWPPWDQPLAPPATLPLARRSTPETTRHSPFSLQGQPGRYHTALRCSPSLADQPQPRHQAQRRDGHGHWATCVPKRRELGRCLSQTRCARYYGDVCMCVHPTLPTSFVRTTWTVLDGPAAPLACGSQLGEPGLLLNHMSPRWANLPARCCAGCQAPLGSWL